jgi:hypothetical protein
MISEKWQHICMQYWILCNIYVCITGFCAISLALPYIDETLINSLNCATLDVELNGCLILVGHADHISFVGAF